MSIEFSCQQCGRMLRVDDSVSGKQARCPNCSHVQTVPMLVVPPEEESSEDPIAESSPTEENRSEVDAFPSDPADGESPFVGDMPFPVGQGPKQGGSPGVGEGTAEDVNPYQTPNMAESNITARPMTVGGGAIVPTRITFSDLLNDTLNFFQRDVLGFVLIGVVFYVLQISFFIPRGMVELAVNAKVLEVNSYVFLLIGLQLFQSVAQLFLTLGALRTILHMIRGGDFLFSMLFSAAPLMVKGIVLGFLYAVLGILGTLPLLALFLYAWLEGVEQIHVFFEQMEVFSLLALVGVSAFAFFWSIFIVVRFVWSFVILADKNCGIFTALGQSWRISRYNSLTLFLAILTFSIVAFGGYLLTCTLGYILIMPFMLCGMVVAYLLMAGQPSLITPGWQPGHSPFFDDQDGGESAFRG